MKQFLLSILALLLVVACKQTTSKDEFVLVEMCGFDDSLKACFEQNLLNGKADLSGIRTIEEDFHQRNPNTLK